MSSTWIIILIGMIGGNFLLNVAPVGFYVEAVVIINLLILALAFLRSGGIHLLICGPICYS